ncbi:hypothetical protein LV457_09870 [Mycobacterium sp. MYCO198283]|uniref:hypothetical protein n=1 Tax=Mycobacterium sp. MYCO198283 TaxID=2883505 RepID=UPI001E586025|nr:hypothetical protein [Mycobacterium sp. MYCO198283]MCG5432593.1 hypothetical protein [Mycobacterium sp. MYCO198283]
MTVLAHGLGGSTDLPIPLSYALIGAAWALTATFGVVALAWRTPRFDPEKPGRPVPAGVQRVVDARATRLVVAVLALLFAAWAVMAGIFGPQNGENALPGTFYVLLWVGLVAASLFFGPVWRVLSPMRTVTRVLPEPRRRYPVRLGYWPAAAGLFAFVWLELASPDPGSLTAIKWWLLCYAAVMLGGALAFGDGWLRRADPFEVYSVAVSRLSVWRRRRDGRIAVGNPFDTLPSMPVRPGLVAVLAVLLGSTAFDSFSAGPAFRNFLDTTASSAATASLLKTAGLLCFVTVVGVTFWLAAQATGGVDRAQRRALPGLLAHSLIPIVVGYIFAHYLTYLVERGQQTVIYLADPLGRGWNLLGLGDAEVTYVLSMHPAVLATVKVACVVAGHMGGVIAAHDKALRVLPRGHQLTGQLAMMLVMVFYTFTGLYLLFGG